MSSFSWKTLPKPIVGLSPMDGVTDAAFRYMVAKYSKPSVIFTEFTNVEGLARGTVKLLYDFLYSPLERPVIAQVFGTNPQAFYLSTLMVCAMGFDGIDINMGCPDNDVAKRGGGAALIKNPKLAKEIILAVKKGVDDWTNGITLKKAGIHQESIHFIEHFVAENSIKEKRNAIPVSVKTRIGFDSIVIEEWVKHLLEMPIANISIHGRTLKQMYTGLADWEAIGKAANIIKQTSVTVLGNGDIKTLPEAYEKIKTYHLDGVLVGRATFGNPFFFDEKAHNPTLVEKLSLCLEHAEYYTKILEDKPFIALRKHLAWYCKGFENASELRSKLVQVHTLDDIKRIIEENKK